MREQHGATVMYLRALTVLIVTDDRVDKTIMHPSDGTWMKNRDKLPDWIKEIVGRM